MIEITTWIGSAIGLLAGWVHATMLWRSVRDRSVQRISVWTPLFGVLRLGLVATLLVAAAINGQILAAAAGWAIGFASLATWFTTRRTVHPMDQRKANHGMIR